MEATHRRTMESSDVLASFDRALPRVYDYVLFRCRDRALAEDLTSETFLAACRSVVDGATDTVNVTWLIGIARHKLVDHWRQQEREQRHLYRVGVTDEVDDDLTSIEPGRAMEVLAGMNPMQAAALTLRHVDGLSVPEVAAALERSVHATETLLSRAHGNFRSRYVSTNGARDE